MRAFEILESQADLEELFEASRAEPIVLFKHSLACGASFSAKEEVERFLTSSVGDGTRVAMIEIQNHRDLSDAVAERLRIRHASPQVFVIRSGRAVWDASHWKITKDRLEKQVSAAREPAGREEAPGCS